MFNGNYINIDTVLSTISDYPFMEGFTKREAANGLVSLLRLIGAVLPMEQDYETIEIKEHRGDLPKGVIYINGVNNKGTLCTNKGIPMRYASDIYLSALHSDAAKEVCEGRHVCSNDIPQLYGGTMVDVPDVKVTGSVGEMNLQVWTAGGSLDLAIAENSYNINGTRINTSFSCGFVEIAFDTVKVDDNNYPMIPDDEPFKEAFKYYLLKKRVEPEFFRGNVTQMVYAEVNKQYEWYVGSAGNSFNMPGPDQVQTMINGLVRILPPGNNTTDGWRSFNK